MKKVGIIIAALVLTFGFSQCKKAETPSTDEGVFITLKASYGQRGEKTGFIPEAGSFVWSEGVDEYVYVGGSEHYGCLGVLSGYGQGTDNMNFSGTLDITPYPAETLHFFYLGKGVERTGDNLVNLDFSNQDGTLENVTNYHIAVGDAVYSESIDVYTATLEMKMAIAYFDVSGFKKADETAETVYLHGDEVYTTATVNYQEGKISGATKGYLNMGTATNGKYIALIPSTTEQTTLKFDSDSKTGSMTFNRGIQAKKYYSNDGAALEVTAGILPQGATPGLFSVSATQMVRFSKGNLKYYCSTSSPQWKFEDNQYDHVVFDISAYSDNSEKWIDLFGWGTSGYSHGAMCYQPWSTSTTDDDYRAYGSTSNHLYNSNGSADWGYNNISNGVSGWRTLKNDNGNDGAFNEWIYIFNNRETGNMVNNVNHARYTEATINTGSASVNGMILFPDDYAGPTTSVDGISWGNINSASSWGTQCSMAGWTTLETFGCVFLPAAGYRSGSKIMQENEGFYWSSSHGDYSSDGNGMAFYGTNYTVVYPRFPEHRCQGRSVRLVRDL